MKLIKVRMQRHWQVEYHVLTPIVMQFSSGPVGNLTTNLDPAFSSESFRGRKRQTTLILSSAAISLSAAIVSDRKLEKRLQRNYTYHSTLVTHGLPGQGADYDIDVKRFVSRWRPPTPLMIC